MGKQDDKKEDEQDDKGEFELANYFVVALKILEFEEKKERIWFSKLVESLSGIFSRNEVAKSLNKLEDWFIVKQKHGETSPGHAGTLYYLIEDKRGTIIEIKDFIKGKKFEITTED